MIRPTREDDRPAVMEILRASGQFDDEALGFVDQMLVRHLNSSGSEIWLTAEEGAPVGVAYCAPEPVSPGVWNLLMLWLRSDRLGGGFGTALIQTVEALLHRQGARMLIVETSSRPAFKTARAFYERRGFLHEATLRDYYAEGDDKLILTRKLTRHLT